ncbi:hypothetical protein V1264_004895 [Littorina saxatilis]
MKVAYYKKERHHTHTFDPSCFPEKDDARYHPFRMVQREELTRHLPCAAIPRKRNQESLMPWGQLNFLRTHPHGELLPSRRDLLRPLRKGDKLPEILLKKLEPNPPGKDAKRPALNPRSVPHMARKRLQYICSGRPISGKNLDGRVWTQEDEGEYQIFNQLIHNMRRRRSGIIRHRWKRAARLLTCIRKFCRMIALMSREKMADLMTFTDIGDMASEGSTSGEYTMMDVGYTSKKLDGGLGLSTKVRVKMTHPPETRTKDEVTLILCELQSYPTFCTYPMAVQKLIAKCGMYMPVEKRRVIIRQGHEAHFWYFCISGQGMETEIVEKNERRIQNTVKFISAGMSFGEDAILDHCPHATTVMSRRNMQLIRLDKALIDDVFREVRNRVDETPGHITYLTSLPFMANFPMDVLLRHPSMCFQYYVRPNVVLVKDSQQSEWIIVVRSGSVVIQMFIPSTKASWRDLNLALAHPTINIDGQPLPRTDTGPGRRPTRVKDHALYHRMSANDIEASDLDEVPSLHMTRAGSRNVHHGLHLLGPNSKIKCPWPLTFLNAMNRTAFGIQSPEYRFPVEPTTGPRRKLNMEPRERHLSMALHFELTGTTEKRGDLNHRSENATSSKADEGSPTKVWSGGNSDFTIGELARNKFFLTAVDGQPAENKAAGSIPEEGDYVLEAREKRDERNMNENKSRYKSDAAADANRSTDKVAMSRRNIPWKPMRPQKEFKAPKIVVGMADCDVIKKKPQPASAAELRKRYVVPRRCRPPVPDTDWRTSPQSVYHCTSPPVYVKIETLTEGDCFGLDQLNEPGWDCRDQSGAVTLISNGAEVVMLSKRFFMSFADEKTHVAVRDNMRIYPTCEAVQTRYRLQLAWQLYSQKVKDEFFKDLKTKGRKHSGTYFQFKDIDIGDPYSILTETD